MIGFIDDHRAAYGVEPIREVFSIAPSTYRAHAAQRRDPTLLSPRAKRDAALREKIDVFGARPFRSMARAISDGS